MTAKLKPTLVCFCGGKTVLRPARCRCEGSCECGLTQCGREISRNAYARGLNQDAERSLWEGEG